MPAQKKGGLRPTTYVMIAGGSVAAYLGFRWYENNKAAAAQTATTGGTTIPTDLTAGTSTPSAPGSLDQWVQQVLSGAQYTNKYTNSALYSDIQAWLNGNCVSASGYSIIGNAIETLGVPPGYSPPFLTACPSTPTTTPAKTTTTTPAKTVSPTTGASVPKSSGSAIPSVATLAAILNQEVGGLSTITGKNATAAQVQKWEAEAKAKGLTGQAAQYFIQTQNIGAVSGAKSPTIASINSLAIKLAGGSASWAQLPSAQRGYYQEIANVQLQSELNK